MSCNDWEILTSVDEVGGRLKAQILEGYLKAQGVEVIISQESAGSSVFPVTFGALGKVEILVKSSQREIAEELLQQVYDDRILEDELEEKTDSSQQDDIETMQSSPGNQG